MTGDIADELDQRINVCESTEDYLIIIQGQIGGLEARRWRLLEKDTSEVRFLQLHVVELLHEQLQRTELTLMRSEESADLRSYAEFVIRCVNTTERTVFPSLRGDEQ